MRLLLMMRLLLVIVLAAMCFGYQPEGTAPSCDNYRSTTHKCACAKAMMGCKMPGGGAKPDAKCFTYCRPEKCSCAGPGCTSRR